MNFAKNLKNLREKNNLSKAEFARKLNIPYTTYNNYESGTGEPKLETFIKMASILKVSTDELLGITHTKLEKYIETCESLGITCEILSEYYFDKQSETQPNNFREGVVYEKILIKDGINLYTSKYGASCRMPQNSFIKFMDTAMEEFGKKNAEMLHDKIILSLIPFLKIEPIQEEPPSI